MQVPEDWQFFCSAFADFPNTKQCRNTFLFGLADIRKGTPLFWGFSQASFILRILPGLLYFEVFPSPPLFWGFSQASFILRFLPGLLYFEVSLRPNPLVLVITEVLIFRSVWNISTVILNRQTEVFGGKPIEVLLCAQDIADGLTWDRTWATEFTIWLSHGTCSETLN